MESCYTGRRGWREASGYVILSALVIFILLKRASFDSTVKIWNITTGECVHTLGSHKEAIYSVAWSPDGKYLASGSFDHTINVWSLAAPVKK